MKKIIIIGSGAMGSAFAVPCVENKNDVTIVGTHLEDNLIKNIIANDNFHSGLKTKLPKEIKFKQFNELRSILEKDVDLIVAGISSIGIEWFAKQISKNYKKKLPIVLLTKGLSIVDNKLTTLSDKIKNILEKNNLQAIIIPSMRTPKKIIELSNNYFGKEHLVINDIDKKAYLSGLSLAKYIVVTCDSTSMISEAALTGKPIYIAEIPPKIDDYRFRRFRELFTKLNIVKNLNEKVEIWNYETLDETNRIAKEIKRKIS